MQKERAYEWQRESNTEGTMMHLKNDVPDSARVGSQILRRCDHRRYESCEKCAVTSAWKQQNPDISGRDIVKHWHLEIERSFWRD
jgi:hypothetical protein